MNPTIIFMAFGIITTIIFFLMLINGDLSHRVGKADTADLVMPSAPSRLQRPGVSQFYSGGAAKDAHRFHPSGRGMSVSTKSQKITGRQTGSMSILFPGLNVFK